MTYVVRRSGGLVHQYAVIVENDISRWQDETGTRYHFPKRYAGYLTPGTRLLHYKGRLRDRTFAPKRLSPEPHYFAFSVAGEHVPDPKSHKGDLFLYVEGYTAFPVPVPHRVDGQTLEYIKPERQGNFWRDGVRPSTYEVFARVAELAQLYFAENDQVDVPLPDDFTSAALDGNLKEFHGTRYERTPALRKAAIALHGTSCFACEVALGGIYGEIAEGFIHIHHKRPLYLTGPTVVDPRIDLVLLCPNCHAIAHLGGQTRTVNAIRAMLGKSPLVARD